ncbi:hypothetical protein B0T14DRAFT_599070 [Immersiella caudata]|uniref:Uncharacterized protein n=1 Tax=Immersiella caudata TaxID=314043 RepID=A0AA40CCY7_9PEZI|nr:hypothetical protein B0T14DRAFT_599070 [Immersiella caudata]
MRDHEYKKTARSHPAETFRAGEPASQYGDRPTIPSPSNMHFHTLLLVAPLLALTSAAPEPVSQSVENPVIDRDTDSVTDNLVHPLSKRKCTYNGCKCRKGQPGVFCFNLTETVATMDMPVIVRAASVVDVVIERRIHLERVGASRDFVKMLIAETVDAVRNGKANIDFRNLLPRRTTVVLLVKRFAEE